MSTSSPGSAQTQTQLPPAIANLLASTSQQAAVAGDVNAPATVPNSTTVSTVPPSNNAGPALLPQPQSQSASAPAPQYNIPPLPVFLSMPPPMQQQIFQSVPPHIQQQMLSSLPPPLQNQLGPLMRPNNAPPFPPVSKYQLLLADSL